MDLEETTLLTSLDRLIQSPALQPALQTVAGRVRDQLAVRSESVMTWEAIPLAIFGATLPSPIESAWIFVLRAGANTGPERHPNSHQRMMSFIGTGDLQTRDGQDGSWRSNVLISDQTRPLEERWISIPPNVWHQPVIPAGNDWVVVSFHTVPAEQLIEERPNDEQQVGTKQMRYLD